LKWEYVEKENFILSGYQRESIPFYFMFPSQQVTTLNPHIFAILTEEEKKKS